MNASVAFGRLEMMESEKDLKMLLSKNKTRLFLLFHVVGGHGMKHFGLNQAKTFQRFSCLLKKQRLQG